MGYEIVEENYRFLNIPSGDLRISITDQCNMNCSYCHNEGQLDVGHRHFLSFDMIMGILERAVKYGVVKVRLTGGEPLLHPDIKNICVNIKAKYKFSNFGINTNAYKKELLIELCKLELFDQIVIGVDYYSNKVSKDSCIGPSPMLVLDTARILKNYGYNVQIASVYMGDDVNKMQLIKYCLENNIMIKLIENTRKDRMPDNRYFEFVKAVVEYFDLKIGMTVDINQLYGLKNGVQVIRFFQSHCNRGECGLCRNLHMRITSMGYAKPCLFNKKTEEYLLDPNTFDRNMRKAIVNLGKGTI